MVKFGMTDIYMDKETTLKGDTIVDKTKDTNSEFRFLAVSHLYLYSFMSKMNLSSFSMGIALYIKFDDFFNVCWALLATS